MAEFISAGFFDSHGALHISCSAEHGDASAFGPVDMLPAGAQAGVSRPATADEVQAWGLAPDTAEDGTVLVSSWAKAQQAGVLWTDGDGWGRLRFTARAVRPGYDERAHQRSLWARETDGELLWMLRQTDYEALDRGRPRVRALLDEAKARGGLLAEWAEWIAAEPQEERAARAEELELRNEVYAETGWHPYSQPDGWAFLYLAPRQYC